MKGTSLLKSEYSIPCHGILTSAHKYVLHLDWDYPIPEHWIKVWEQEKTAMLESLGFTVDRIITKPSPSRKGGSHIWIHIISPQELSEDEVNMLQWLCGDDPTRVWINRMRIDRGLKKYWNKLFSRHVWVREMDEKCKTCKIRRTIYEMRKELKE